MPRGISNQRTCVKGIIPNVNISRGLSLNITWITLVDNSNAESDISCMIERQLASVAFSTRKITAGIRCTLKRKSLILHHEGICLVKHLYLLLCRGIAVS